MPIPVLQFPTLKPPADVTPVLTGMGKGISLVQQLERLRQMPAERARTQAQAQVAQEQARFAPLDMAIKATQQQQTGTRFGPAYQLGRVVMGMPLENRSRWIAAHTKEWEAVLNILGNQALQQGAQPQTGPGAVVSRLMQQYFPSPTPAEGAPSPAIVPTRAMQPGVAPAPGITPAAPTVPPGQEVTATAQPAPAPQQPAMTAAAPPAFGSTPEQTQSAVLANQHLSNIRGAGTKISDRARNASIMEDWLSTNRADYAKKINTALSYAGIKGRSKEYQQKWLNKNPDALSDLDWYRKTFSTILSNQLKLMEGMGATDQQKVELLSMIDESKDIMSNPTRSRMAINKMMKSWQQIGLTIMSKAEPFFKGTYGKTYNLKPFSGDYLSTGVPAEKIKEAPKGTAAMNDPLGIRQFMTGGG